jgi:hypothetical protein
MGTYPHGLINFYAGQSRMYDPLLLLCTNLGCVSFTSAVMADHLGGVSTDTVNPNIIALAGQLFKNVVHIPFHGALLPLYQGPDLNPMQVEVVEDYRLKEVRAAFKTGRHSRLIAMGSFVTFYENYRPWLEYHAVTNFAANKGNAFRYWPTAWQMGRVVRNAMSHGGCIAWKDKRLPPVTWEGLTYSPADHGRKIFELDLTLADLILLLIEMGKALDQLGSPLEPPTSE